MRLARPYLTSEDWLAAWLLLLAIVIVIVTMTNIGLGLLISFLQRLFYTALQEKHGADFTRALFWFTPRPKRLLVPPFILFVTINIAMASLSLYLQAVLQLRWQRWLTARTVRRWLSDHAYYHLPQLARAGDIGTDNPDQRVQEDIEDVTRRSGTMVCRHLCSARRVRLPARSIVDLAVRTGRTRSRSRDDRAPDWRAPISWGRVLTEPGRRYPARRCCGRYCRWFQRCHHRTVRRRQDNASSPPLRPLEEGRVVVPTEDVVFVPQRAYLPPGALRSALCYPDDPSLFPEAELGRVLTLIGLPELAASLDIADIWSRRLSPGQQQRLALGRAILQQPRWLFLDEPTASLDPQARVALQQVLATALPSTTLVTFTHDPGIAASHDRRIDIARPIAA